MKLMTIGRVAEVLQVSIPSLRNWELAGMIPKPSRTLTDRRFYTAADVEAIRKYLEEKHPGK